MNDALDQEKLPKNNLDTYRILYIVAAVLNLLGVLGFGLYAAFGVFFLGNLEGNEPELKWIFGLIGGIGAMVSLVLGILNFYTAKCIKQRKNYSFVFVMAIIACLSGVLRLILGVFTLVEITKPEVKKLFTREKEDGIVY